MNIQKLIDEFEHIKIIVENLPEMPEDELPGVDRELEKIYQICENVLIDWKVEKRLNDTKTTD